MDQSSLVTEEIDAGTKFLCEFDKYEPVTAAFWLKSSDEDFRYLYVASNRIDDSNFDVAYGEVLRVANEMRSPYLDPFRVKLVNTKNPLAKAAIDVNQRFPGRIPTRFSGNSFGGTSIDDVYIYPSPLV